MKERPPEQTRKTATHANLQINQHHGRHMLAGLDKILSCARRVQHALAVESKHHAPQRCATWKEDSYWRTDRATAALRPNGRSTTVHAVVRDWGAFVSTGAAAHKNSRPRKTALFLNMESRVLAPAKDRLKNSSPPPGRAGGSFQAGGAPGLEKLRFGPMDFKDSAQVIAAISRAREPQEGDRQKKPEATRRAQAE